MSDDEPGWILSFPLIPPSLPPFFLFLPTATSLLPFFLFFLSISFLFLSFVLPTPLASDIQRSRKTELDQLRLAQVFVLAPE